MTSPIRLAILLQSIFHSIAVRVTTHKIADELPADIVAEASRVLRRDCGAACLEVVAYNRGLLA